MNPTNCAPTTCIQTSFSTWQHAFKSTLNEEAVEAFNSTRCSALAIQCTFCTNDHKHGFKRINFLRFFFSSSLCLLLFLCLQFICSSTESIETTVCPVFVCSPFASTYCGARTIKMCISSVSKNAFDVSGLLSN